MHHLRFKCDQMVHMILLLLLLCFAFPYSVLAETAIIQTTPITHFKSGSDQKYFGRFEFIGGFEMTSDHSLLGAMSAFRFRNGREKFLGLMDTGHWYSGRVVRNEQGRAVGIEDFLIEPIRDQYGQWKDDKWNFDAESLALSNRHIYAGFEGNARIDAYPIKKTMVSKPQLRAKLPIPRHELRKNGGLEALAIAPPTSSIAGSLVAVAESSVDERGHLFAAIIDGPEHGIFFVKQDQPYKVTDADFLPNGDLLLLERRFNITRGVGMRIRHIKSALLKRGAVVDGDVWLDVGAGHQIDNMEGLDVTTDASGNVFVTLISDDNHSIFQRNLFLEFRLKTIK